MRPACTAQELPPGWVSLTTSTGKGTGVTQSVCVHQHCCRCRRRCCCVCRTACLCCWCTGAPCLGTCRTSAVGTQCSRSRCVAVTLAANLAPGVHVSGCSCLCCCNSTLVFAACFAFINTLPLSNKHVTLLLGAAQVLVAVVTNMFLSGLSSGQLAQLLPNFLVPAALSNSLTAAAAARPADSSAAASLGQTAPGRALLSPLESLAAASWYQYEPHNSRMGPGPFSIAPNMCPVPGLYTAASAVCPAGHPVLQPPALHAATAGAGVTSAQELEGFSTQSSSTAATSHLLLLFALEHLVLLLVVLVWKLIPDAPSSSRGSRPAPTELMAPSSAPLAAPKGFNPAQQQGAVSRASTQQPGVVLQQQPQLAVPVVAAEGASVSVHGNPLFTQSTARKSEA